MTSHLSTQDHMSVSSLVKYAQVNTLDSAGNIFFERELKSIIPEMFEFDHAKIKGRSLFPIDRSAGPGATNITWQQITKVGMAKIISDYADDIPIVNAFAEEKTSNIRTLADAVMWSLKEIASAQRVGRPLERFGVEAANEALLRLENSIIFLGDATHGLVGLFSAGTGIPSGVTPSATNWSTATGAQMVADMMACVHAIPAATGDVEAPTRLLLPTTAYNQAASKRMEPGTDTTALQFFIANNQYLSDVQRVRELETAGPGGVRAMVAYDPRPGKVRLAIPQDINSIAPQNENLTVKVIYLLDAGGLIIHKPLSLNICHTF